MHSVNHETLESIIEQISLSVVTVCLQLLSEVLLMIFPVVKGREAFVNRNCFTFCQKGLVTSLKLLIVFVCLKFTEGELLCFTKLPSLLKSSNNLVLDLHVLRVKRQRLDSLYFKLSLAILVDFSCNSAFGLLCFDIVLKTCEHRFEKSDGVVFETVANYCLV